MIEASRRLVAEEHRIIEDGIYKGWLYLALYGTAKAVGGSLKLSDEHTGFAWPTAQAALSYDLTSGTRKALEISLAEDQK